MTACCAPWKKAFALIHWAACFALISSCTSRSPAPTVEHEEQCVMAESHPLIDEGLRKIASGCRGLHNGDVPVLYAHFLETSLEDGVCFADVVNNVTGALSCAPGPFLIDHRNVVDTPEQFWHLANMPDYFVWHLDGQNFIEENFYITNQSGFPIKSHVIKLESDQQSTLVLFPKIALQPNVTYFLYMTLTKNTSQDIWIQPIRAQATLH